MVEIKHGTYVGVNQHNREGSPVCDACREARNEYMRERRQKNGDEIRRWERFTQKSMNRAKAILIQRHNAEFQRILAQVRAQMLKETEK